MLQQCGIKDADLLIACTSRDESNLIAAMFTKKLSPDTKAVVRTTDEEYLDVWRERQLDVDLIVSSEHETAHAISRTIGVPAARQTDVFADGKVQIVEFDVERGRDGGDRDAAAGGAAPARLEGRRDHPRGRDGDPARRPRRCRSATGSS